MPILAIPPNNDNALPLMEDFTLTAIYECLDIPHNERLIPAVILEIIKSNIVGLRAAQIDAKAKTTIPVIIVFLKPKDEINIPAGISNVIAPRYLAPTTIPIRASFAPRLSLA